MSDPLDQLTPDESLRADNQIKLLKLDLEHNVQFAHFEDDTPPEAVGEFLDSILALEEMHKNPTQRPLYDIIGRPPFQPTDELTDAEIPPALDSLLQQMAAHHIFLNILAPEDYDERTIYQFLTEELFQHETTHMGGGWNTNFIYEEFHQNHRYDIQRQGEDFIRLLTEQDLDKLTYCLADSLLDRQEGVMETRVKPEVMARLGELVENWWPHRLQGGSLTNIHVATDTETAEATLHLELDTESLSSPMQLEGTIQFSRHYEWWSVEQVILGDWSLR